MEKNNPFEQIYRELIENQLELDEDAKRVLYENLWDLYSE